MLDLLSAGLHCSPVVPLVEREEREGEADCGESMREEGIDSLGRGLGQSSKLDEEMGGIRYSELGSSAEPPDKQQTGSHHFVNSWIDLKMSEWVNDGCLGSYENLGMEGV